jgi:hypothetical protein
MQGSTIKFSYFLPDYNNKHNQEILNDVKKVKRKLQEFESKNMNEDITTKIEEDNIKKLQVEIFNKVEESLKIDEENKM